MYISRHKSNRSKRIITVPTSDSSLIYTSQFLRLKLYQINLKKLVMRSSYCMFNCRQKYMYVSDRQEIRIKIDRKRVDRNGKTGGTR